MADEVTKDDLTLHPTERTQRYMSFSGFDIGFVVIVGVSLYLGTDLIWPEARGWVAIIGGVGFLLSLMRSGVYNLRLYRLPGFFGRNFSLRRLKHNRLWTERQKSDVSSVQLDKKDVSVAQSILPIRAVRFDDANNARNMGLVVNEKYRMITFLVRVSGTNITTKTIAEQKAFNERLAEAFKFAAATVRRSQPWFGMVYRSRPDNPYEYEKMLWDLVDHRTLLPEGEKKPEIEWDENDYINNFVHEVVVQDGLNTIQSLVAPEMVFTFTVKYTSRFAKVLSDAQKAKEGKEAKRFEYRNLLKEPFYRLKEAVIPLLSDIMTGDMEVFDFEDLVMYLRKAHDLNIEEYYLQTYLNEQRGESMSSTSWMPTGYIDEYNDKLDTNGSWHATIFPTSFPDEFAMPFTGREFYIPRTLHFTASTIGKFTKGNHRYRYVQGKSQMTDGAKDFFGITNSGPKAHKAQQQVYNNLAQLDKSGWAVAYLPHLTISKKSEFDLEQAVEHVTSRLDGSFFEPRRVVGASVQWEEFFSAATGIPLRF